MRRFICWLVTGHIWDKVGDPYGSGRVVRGQMWQCAHCAYTVVVDLHAGRFL